jgi:hypothetical protein
VRNGNSFEQRLVVWRESLREQLVSAVLNLIAESQHAVAITDDVSGHDVVANRLPIRLGYELVRDEQLNFVEHERLIERVLGMLHGDGFGNPEVDPCEV